MAIISRVTRLFKADFHAVLDQIEEPATLLRQSIREMEEEMLQTEKQLDFLRQELELTQSRLATVDKVLQDFEHQLDLCFESDQEELVKGLIKKKLENIRLHEFIQSRQQSLQKEVIKQQTLLTDQQATLEGLRHKSELLCPVDNKSEIAGRDAAPEYRITDQEVEIAFLREKNRRERS